MACSTSDRSSGAVSGNTGRDERARHDSGTSWAVGDLWTTAGDGDLACAVKSLGNRNNWGGSGCRRLRDGARLRNNGGGGSWVSGDWDRNVAGHDAAVYARGHDGRAGWAVGDSRSTRSNGDQRGRLNGDGCWCVGGVDNRSGDRLGAADN